MEYPVIPTCLTKKTGILKLQRVQNIAVKKAAKEGNPRRRITNENLHNRFGMEPLNTRLFNRAAKIWNRLQIFEPELVELSNQLREQQNWEHAWWPSISKYINNRPPVPKYL